MQYSHVCFQGLEIFKNLSTKGATTSVWIDGITMDMSNVPGTTVLSPEFLSAHKAFSRTIIKNPYFRLMQSYKIQSYRRKLDIVMFGYMLFG